VYISFVSELLAAAETASDQPLAWAEHGEGEDSSNAVAEDDSKQSVSKLARDVLETLTVILSHHPPSREEQQRIRSMDLKELITELKRTQSAISQAFPSIQGLAVFPKVSRIRVQEQGANCQVAFEECIPCVRVLATKDIQAGAELILKEDDGFDVDNQITEEEREGFQIISNSSRANSRSRELDFSGDLKEGSKRQKVIIRGG